MANDASTKGILQTEQDLYRAQIDALTRELLQAEQALYRAQIAGDLVALERLLSPNLVYVHSTAVAESRDEYLAAVADGRYEYEHISTRYVRVRFHGPVALIDGICTMHVGMTRQAKDLIHLVFVLAWTKERGVWQLEHRHATRVPAERA